MSTDESKPVRPDVDPPVSPDAPLLVTSVFVVTGGGSGSPPLLTDFSDVGIDVVGSSSAPETLVSEVIRCDPDLVVCYEPHPRDAFFACTAALQNVAPRPVIVFTGDPDAERIGRAVEAGIHVYIVNGYAPQRLRSVVHVAQARFRRDQVLRAELTDVQHRFNERKLIDRAKGILMRVRNVSEDEAYKVLRTAAMQGKQRIGQVAQQVIDVARYAEGVNRAGQLRMLSQRLVKLHALTCAEVRLDATAELCRESLEQIETNLSVLGRMLSRPTFGDLLDAVLVPWTALKAALVGKPTLAGLPEVDRLAERLLTQAEALTRTLQTAGFASALHVIDVSGRQRMLSQRLAKQALIAGLLPGGTVDKQAIATTRKSFVDGLAYLQRIPLTSTDIKALLDDAVALWERFAPLLARAEEPAIRDGIAVLSEALLTQFAQLTDSYERGMQMLME